MPEQLFSTPHNPAEGVSAVKALAVAAAEGQRIYTIDQDNLSSALDALTLDPATEGDIRNAVHAGLQVTAHQHQISHAGFTGAGYILLDPDTGSGAYKISGGADGGLILGLVLYLLLAIFLIAVLSLTPLFIASGLGLVWASILIASIGFVGLVHDIENAIDDCSFGGAAEAITILLVLFIAGLFVNIGDEVTQFIFELSELVGTANLGELIVEETCS